MSATGSGDEKQERVLVSACLLGLNTRYDGGSCKSRPVLALRESACIIPACPEQLGGLPTPRPPAWITRGDGYDVLDGEARVVTWGGRDVTDEYLRGARQTRKLARSLNVTRACLKERSPACGVSLIKRSGSKVEGCGVAAALLMRSEIEVEGFE